MVSRRCILVFAETNTEFVPRRGFSARETKILNGIIRISLPSYGTSTRRKLPKKNICGFTLCWGGVKSISGIMSNGRIFRAQACTLPKTANDSAVSAARPVAGQSTRKQILSTRSLLNFRPRKCPREADEHRTKNRII